MSERSPGALVVSLDLDLAWGPPHADLQGSLDAIRRTLDLLEHREIHATWACVGLAFARDCEDALSFAPRLRPTYRNHALSPYPSLERGEPDGAPARYFAPELIKAIAARPHQEIASHSFSHYRCEEPGQTPAQFEADLAAAVAIAARSGIELESLVLPGNPCNPDYLPILARHGITSHRGRQPGWAHARSGSTLLTTVRRGLRLANNYSLLLPDRTIPMQRFVDGPHDPPINIPASRFLRPYDPRLRQLETLRVHRMQSEMAYAAENAGVYHLWWRPQQFAVHTAENLVVLDDLLRQARALAGEVGFRSMTMAELARSSSPW